MFNLAPIGVFDSGAGGLSVLRELRRLLPHEAFEYIADTAHVPYGPKSAHYIRQRSRCLAEFLVEQRQVKALVVACNTATAAAIDYLRQHLACPIIGIEPAVKPAVAATRNGVVGVLATTGTLRSARFAALLGQFAREVRVVTQPCPGLVEQVEAGELHSSATRALLQDYLQPIQAAGADTLILGCTHYPFLRPLLAQLLAPEVAVIDTGAAVARRLQQQLALHQLLNSSTVKGQCQYWSSGVPQTLERLLAQLEQRPMVVQRLPPEVANG